MTAPDAGRRIPVTILGGYLGSGKTTLLNHLLATAEERLAVLVNDFGSINVDEALIAADDGDTISLTNGCICCSLVDGFGEALERVRAIRPRPSRLVIEASGVADPAAIAAWGHGPGLTLDGVLTVVDADGLGRSLRDQYIGDVVRQQIVAADLVVLNKLDLVDTGAAERVRARIAELAPAPIIGAIDGVVPAAVALGTLDPVGAREPAAPPAGEAHLAWSHTFVTAPTDDELRTWLEALPASTVRAKGVIAPAPGSDGCRIVHRVGSRSVIRPEPDRPHDGASVIVGIDVGPALPAPDRLARAVPADHEHID